MGTRCPVLVGHHVDEPHPFKGHQLPIVRVEDTAYHAGLKDQVGPIRDQGKG
jgi:hypothetical protein